MYSPRPGTYGARKYEDNVPQTLKKDRHARLNDLLIKISDENNKKEIGTWREMMVRDIQDRAFI